MGERRVPAVSSLLATLAPAWPGYWLEVRDYAEELLISLGPSAARWSRQEAEDSLSPAWAAFMRRVARRIERRTRGLGGRLSGGDRPAANPFRAAGRTREGSHRGVLPAEPPARRQPLWG